MMKINGEIVEKIEILNGDEVACIIDVNTKDWGQINKVTNFIENPLYLGEYNTKDKFMSFIETRVVDKRRQNRVALYPEWAKTTLDEVYYSNGCSLDDYLWIKFYPRDKYKKFKDVNPIMSKNM